MTLYTIIDDRKSNRNGWIGCAETEEEAHKLGVAVTKKHSVYPASPWLEAQLRHGVRPKARRWFIRSGVLYSNFELLRMAMEKMTGVEGVTL